MPNLAAAQTGKLHFGVVLGWSVVGSTVLWFVANNIGGGTVDVPDGGAPGLYDCCCLLGYCLLPLIAHALTSLLIPKCGSSYVLNWYYWGFNSRFWCCLPAGSLPASAHRARARIAAHSQVRILLCTEVHPWPCDSQDWCLGASVCGRVAALALALLWLARLTVQLLSNHSG